MKRRHSPADPTAGTIYTLEHVESDPMALNNNLGGGIDVAAYAVSARLDDRDGHLFRWSAQGHFLSESSGGSIG